MLDFYKTALKKQQAHLVDPSNLEKEQKFKKSLNIITENLNKLAGELKQNQKVATEVEKACPQLFKALTFQAQINEKTKNKGFFQ